MKSPLFFLFLFCLMGAGKSLGLCFLRGLVEALLSEDCIAYAAQVFVWSVREWKWHGMRGEV